jgi:arylsulfatase A-like enzyme
VFRKIIDSPWLYFSLAGLLLVVAVLSQVQFGAKPRPGGSVEDLSTLAERDDLNIVFIMIDMLRADRLHAYGYERKTSPNIDQLAATGIRFARTESQSSWTKASMASLWTSMYPERTGVQRFFHAVPEEALMPAEILKQAGFATGGVWRNGWVANNFGFGQGFDLYIRPTKNRPVERVKRHNPSAHALQGTDMDATESAIEFMQAYKDRRFFLYIHYMDLHQYLYADISPDFGTGFPDIYDSSIYWTDRNVQHVIEALRDLQLADKTMVVIVSDHGEAFFEHGLEGHARNLYREVLEVPFIIAPPFEIEGGIVVDQEVANLDIWPTILDLLGLPAQPGAEGQSLVPLIFQAAGRGEGAGSDTGDADRAIFSQLDRSWGRVGAESRPRISMVKGKYRMNLRVNKPEDVLLFDRSEDPKEKVNVAAERPEVVAELRAELEEFLAKPKTQWESAPEVELDELRVNQLRALGYVLGGRTKHARPRPGAEEAEGAEAAEDAEPDPGQREGAQAPPQ